VHGTVHKVYGPPGHRHVVIMLTPEISGVVDEPTTVTLPLDDLKRSLPLPDLGVPKPPLPCRSMPHDRARCLLVR
jgi:hypothetical protein